MTVYLSLKAALSQPALLDACFSFHTATATYLVQLVANDNGADTAAVARADEAPPVLRYVPELLTENVQDFMQFLRHFKDQMFEVMVTTAATIRVTACLENLEMSGNLKHVRDVVNSQGNVRDVLY